LDATVTDEDMILVLTMGLPANYENFVMVLDSTPPEIFTLQYVITRLLNEESRIGFVEDTQAETVALAVHNAAAAKREGTSHITCYRCGQKGHYQLNCTASPSNSGSAKRGTAASVTDTDNSDLFGGAW